MFKTDLYIQVLEDLVRARNVTTGQSVEQRPKQPFSHARALVGNFTEAEAAIKVSAQ